MQGSPVKPDRAPLRLLVMAPGGADAAALAGAVVAAARRGGAVAELLAPASENELHRRLSVGGVDLLYFLGRGKTQRTAGHATLDFDSAAGPASRPVNLRHLAGLLATPGGPRLVLLQPLQAGADFNGMARALVNADVPAAMVWPAAGVMPLLADAVRRLCEQWQAGANLASLAALADDAGLPQRPEWAEVHNPGLGRDATPDQAAQRLATALAPSGAPHGAAPGAPPAALVNAETHASAARQRLAAKRASGVFDVFLCHNSADKPAVRAIARALRDRGILPWLDEIELPPGQPWQPLLERQLESIRSAAVCVGRAGVGPWQEQELYGFLREFVARRAPVIPVLLADAPVAPELPVFLRAMTYVDLRLQDVDAMDRLEWGITGIRPAFD